MATKKTEATHRVTAYLGTLPEWSKKICSQLRELILSADPSIEEDWKWGPNYASHGMVCGYMAFQKHVKLTFFNGSAMEDRKGLFNHCMDNEFNRSIKYTEGAPLHEKTLKEYIRESIAVNKKGFKRTVKDKSVEVPLALQTALAANQAALSFFNGLSYGYKKEFVDHIQAAKQEKTRLQRIEQTVTFCTEGKKLNDKYKKTALA